VSNAVEDDIGPSERSDWSIGWSRADRTVTSNTGELLWDYGERYIEVTADKTQGVIGFTEGRRFELPDVQITIETPFVSLLVTSLDNRSIGESSSVLVTAVAREKWTGSEIEGVGEGARLNALGGPPLMMEPVQASLTFNTDFNSAEALDQHGRRTGRALELNHEGAYVLDGRFSTIYYLFEREMAEETGGTEAVNGGERSVDGGEETLEPPGGDEVSEGLDEPGEAGRRAMPDGPAGEQVSASGGGDSGGCAVNGVTPSAEHLALIMYLLLGIGLRRERQT